MITLYHRTNREAAEAILRDGFRDATGSYGTDREFSGIWVSMVPFDANDGAVGKHLLRITLTLGEEEIAPYEWQEEQKRHREWLVPSELLNSNGTVKVADIDCNA